MNCMPFNIIKITLLLIPERHGLTEQENNSPSKQSSQYIFLNGFNLFKS